MNRDDYYNRAKGCEKKIVLSVIIAVLLGLCLKCQAQEQLTYDQLYQLVSNQFKNSSQKFNHLFNRIDSLEKRVKELEELHEEDPWAVYIHDELPVYEWDGDPYLMQKDTTNQIQIDSIFYQNATIKSMEKPDTILPGLYRSGVNYRHKKRPNRP